MTSKQSHSCFAFAARWCMNYRNPHCENVQIAILEGIRAYTGFQLPSSQQHVLAKYSAFSWQILQHFLIHEKTYGTYKPIESTSLANVESISKISWTESPRHYRKKAMNIFGSIIPSLKQKSSSFWKHWRLQTVIKSDLINSKIMNGSSIGWLACQMAWFSGRPLSDFQNIETISERKKGDRSECTHLWGIPLFSLHGKVCAKQGCGDEAQEISDGWCRSHRF